MPSLDGLDPQQPLVLPALDTPLNKKVSARARLLSCQPLSLPELHVSCQAVPSCHDTRTCTLTHTPPTPQVRELLDEIRRQRTAYLRLRVLRRGDPTEQAFYAALVEDRSPQVGSSSLWLQNLCPLG